MSDLGVVVLFGAGVASFASPCVLPLVPAWVGLSLGSSPGRTSTTLRAALPFVIGLAATFAALGAAAGAAGGLIDGAGRWLPRLGGAITVVFGLGLLGFGPRWMRSEHRAVASLPPPGRVPPVVRSVIAGVAAGAAWTPCVGPLLGAALTAAASSGGSLSGAGLLTAYALGVGAPLIAAALLVDGWPAVGRRLAARAEVLRIAGGTVLVVAGVATALRLTPVLLDPLARLGAPS